MIICAIEFHQSYPKPPPVGSRVRRGPHWKWGIQDGGRAGTIVKTDDIPGQFRHRQTLILLGGDVYHVYYFKLFY